MGAVYLATDARLGGRKVAVKVPTLPDDHAAAFLKRIEREAHIAAEFQHPNIGPIYDVGTHDGRPFLVLAYIEGTSLAEHLGRRAKPFDVVQAVELVCVVAEAMHEAHKTGIIHRDLKPDNIMITPEGRPIVMDSASPSGPTRVSNSHRPARRSAHRPTCRWSSSRTSPRSTTGPTFTVSVSHSTSCSRASCHTGARSIRSWGRS
jgi:serine/threonine protein kinase